MQHDGVLTINFVPCSKYLDQSYSPLWKVLNKLKKPSLLNLKKVFFSNKIKRNCCLLLGILVFYFLSWCCSFVFMFQNSQVTSTCKITRTPLLAARSISLTLIVMKMKEYILSRQTYLIIIFINIVNDWSNYLFILFFYYIKPHLL